MIDGGIVVGYVTAYLLKGGKQLADRSLEVLLQRLVERVEAKIDRSSIQTLKARPDDVVSRALVEDRVDDALRADPTFAAQLEQLIASLDRRGGQQFVNQTITAGVNVQSGTGSALGAGRDLIYAPPPRDPSDISDAEPWIKLFIGAGTVLCMVALALFGYTLFTWNPEPGEHFTDVPPGVVRAASVFFVGFALLGIASLGWAMSKRPNRVL